MNKEQIKKVQECASDIKNFSDSYDDCRIYPDRNEEVSYATVLEWLIENPHMAEIAMQIKKIHG